MKSISIQFKIIQMLILLLIVTVNAWAIGEAAALFLLLSPSAQASAASQTYGIHNVNDPLAQIFNPAQLGNFAGENSLGYAWYPQKLNLGAEGSMPINYTAEAFAFGINLKSRFKVPISLGVGMYRIHLDLGDQVYTSEYSPEPLGIGNNYERAKVFSVAVAAITM